MNKLSIVLVFAFSFLILRLSAQTTYYSKSTGNLNTLSTWGTNPNGTGTSPANFSSAGVTYIITNTSFATLSGAWTVSGAGSQVQVGDGISVTEFSVPASFAFNGTVNVSGNSTLTIQHTTIPTINNLANGSTVRYTRAGSQTVRPLAYYNLQISGSGQKSMSNTGNASISNSLIIDAGCSIRFPTINTLTTTISGSVTGAGALVGNGNSNLVISGNGAFGILTFTSNFSLYQLTIARSSGSITLGSNLTVGNHFNHSNGSFNLNGFLLTLNGAVTFPANSSIGEFIGSPTSSLAIGSSTGLITNAIIFNQNSVANQSLSRFTLNRASQTLSLGGSLYAQNAFVHTNGIIQVGTNHLMMGGILSFPTATTNGYLIGSASSSLSLLGNGTIGNSIKFDQSSLASRSFGYFEINRTGGTLLFGNNLICSGPFSYSSGTISIGATLLTLQGDITFPASAASGSITGSATSSLVVNGSGSISNSLWFNQSSTTNRTLSYLNFDRSGQQLSLGNSLIVTTINHNNGQINLGAGLLTLNGGITFPSSLANGNFVGGATASLSIASSTGAIVNPLFFDQTNVLTRSLDYFSFNRAGQTLVLGTGLEINSVFIHSNGLVDLNGTSFAINGALTFPAAVSNGYFIGSTSSSLKIGGSGAVANTLKFDQSSNASKTIDNFKLDRLSGIITLGNNMNCSGSFIHTNGTLSIGSCSLDLSGLITFPASAANGSITGSTTSSLSITGSGAINSSLILNQSSTSARSFNQFVFDRAGQTLVLANNLIVNSFTHLNGAIDLNGTLLTLNTDITLPVSVSNGYFIGSTTSSLTISSSTALLTNPLHFSPVSSAGRSLSRFALTRTGQTLALGTDMIVTDAFAHTSGILNLNSKLLSIGGLISFPSSTVNGYYIGSASSSLAITGSGVISNALRFDQTTATGSLVSDFTMDHTGGTLVFAGNLLCGGTFSHSNGPITIGTSSLVLSGPVYFPASATNGSITGSASSSLAIDGSGAIVNALYLSQVSAAARTINKLSLNRAGQTLVLGNTLITGVLEHTNGLLDLNNTLLTLNGAITFPAAISNGALIGSVNSSLTIAGSGAITNALLMDQSAASNRSMYDVLYSRSGQTLSIGNPLEIRNSIRPTVGGIVTNNFITLKADATRSGMIGTVGGSFSGSITVETYAPAGYTGWTNLGPSGVSGLTVANWESQFFIACNGCPNNEYSTGGYFVSVQSYSEALSGGASYVPLTYTSPLVQGRGYWVFLGNGSTTSTAITYSVNGPAVTGNVVLPVTNSANSGYNLVANPYAAPVDWDLVAADGANTNINGSIYFYDPDLGQTISYAAGVSSPAGYIANGIVPMGQGFYIQATTNTNLTFRETHKSTANTSANPLLRPTSGDSVGTVFRLSIMGSQLDYDETAFRFHPLATNAYDRLYDARKQFQTPGYVGTGPVYDHYTTISSKFQNEDLSINSVPTNSTSDVVIPLLVKTMFSGNYTISPIDIENFNTDACVVLKDKLTGTEHNLRNGPYKFDIKDTTSVPRFELRLCAGAIPTSLKALTANKSNVKMLQTSGTQIVVSTTFETLTPSTVSAYNSLGQAIGTQHQLQGTGDSTTLNFEAYRGQVVTVKVSNANGHTVKKFIVY